MQAQQRGDVGGRGYHDRARQTLGAEVVLYEFLDFPAAFADEADDDDVGLGIAGHHAQQHALAHAGTGEQAHALAAADGQQAVDGAHTRVQHRIDGRARQGIDRLGGQGSEFGARERAQSVQWASGAIQHPAQQGIAHRQVAAQLRFGVAVQFGFARQRNLALDGRFARYDASAGRQA